MSIDYKSIGERIRKLRKKRKMTQEQLRSVIDISSTHMSHIENGSTMLSLPVLIDIANALGTTVDYLLSDSVSSSAHVFRSEIEEILKDCSNYEYRVMVETMAFVKKSLRNIPKSYEENF